MAFLVGNKCDIVDKKVVSTEAGQKFADELKIQFIETSALTGHNVDKLFEMITRKIIDKNPLILDL